MAAAHTPGPWTLTTVPTSIGSCHKIGPFPVGPALKENHACIYADGIRIGIDEKLPRAMELLANARLIAAAPAMLTKLRDLAGECAECSGTAVLPTDTEGEWSACPACADIHAVINKATGAAP